MIGTASLDGDELATVFVHPDHQGKKAGARLIEQLEVIAREQGITTVRVESSVTGTAFYESLGYRRLAPCMTRLRECTSGWRSRSDRISTWWARATTSGTGGISSRH